MPAGRGARRTARLPAAVAAVVVALVLALAATVSWSAPISLVMGVTAGLVTWVVADVPRRLERQVEHATAQLSAAHGQLRAIMNAAQDGILALDEDLRVIDGNPRCAELLGEPIASLQGRHLGDLLDDREALDALRDGTSRPGFHVRVPVHRHDGTSFPAEISLSPPTGDGATRTAIVRDASAEVARENDLRSYASELERLNGELTQLDQVKRDFLQLASHEVRTPITAIRGFSITLAKHFEDLTEDDTRRCLDVIHRQTEKLWQIVNDLLITTKIEGGAVESDLAPVNILNVIERAMLEAQVPASETAIRCREDLACVVDRQHLQRILVAYLSNARKYGAAPYEIHVVDDGRDLVIRVADSGPGVPDEFRPHLFDQFTQASTGVTRTATGTGLGLAVARGLAKAAGGDVWYESAPGEGARFGVRLPRQEPAPQQPPAVITRAQLLERSPAPGVVPGPGRAGPSQADSRLAPPADRRMAP